MHHQFRLSLLQWNPGPARRNPTNIVSAACGKYHAVILQEASDHVPHISEQFLACSGNTDLAILLNKDTFEPDPIVLTFKVDSTSKGTWNMVLLIVRGLLKRPSLSGSPTVTFCSVHSHNVVAKKRDASTDLLRRLHGYLQQHNTVDFIGGDFNMSAFFPQLVTCCRIQSFQHLVIRFCGDSGRWKSRIVSARGFSSCPSVHMSGVWIHMAATSTITPRLALDPVTKQLTFLCFSISAPPTCLAPRASCAANKRNKEDLSAGHNKHERRKRRRA